MKRRSILQAPVVLLVEDEPLVREFEIDVLQDAGFRVLEARTADEAFDMLRGRPDVRIVFTDVDMPGSLNGFEFSRLVHQGWPEVAILVSSGKMAPSAGDLPEGAAFIAKPYRPDELVEQLHKLVREEA
ncbi:MAG TPA: response regulator [Beijerinckiaceae bacterium]|nr:response regulator [Beijerinckiaceae bacterium]